MLHQSEPRVEEFLFLAGVNGSQIPLFPVATNFLAVFPSVRPAVVLISHQAVTHASVGVLHPLLPHVPAISGGGHSRGVRQDRITRWIGTGGHFANEWFLGAAAKVSPSFLTQVNTVFLGATVGLIFRPSVVSTKRSTIVPLPRSFRLNIPQTNPDIVSQVLGQLFDVGIFKEGKDTDDVGMGIIGSAKSLSRAKSLFLGNW